MMPDPSKHRGRNSPVPYSVYGSSERFNLSVSAWYEETAEYYLRLELSGRKESDQSPIFAAPVVDDLPHEQVWQHTLQDQESFSRIRSQEIKVRFPHYYNTNIDSDLRDLSIIELAAKGLDIESQPKKEWDLMDLAMKGRSLIALEEVKKGAPFFGKDSMDDLDAQLRDWVTQKQKKIEEDKLMARYRLDFGEDYFEDLEPNTDEEIPSVLDQSIEQAAPVVQAISLKEDPLDQRLQKVLGRMRQDFPYAICESVHNQDSSSLLLTFPTQAELRLVLWQVQCDMGMFFPIKMREALCASFPVIDKGPASVGIASHKPVLPPKPGKKILDGMLSVVAPSIKPVEQHDPLSVRSGSTVSLHSLEPQTPSSTVSSCSFGSKSSLQSKGREEEAYQSFLQRQPHTPQAAIATKKTNSSLKTHQQEAQTTKSTSAHAKKHVQIMDEMGGTRQEKSVQKFLNRYAKTAGNSRPSSRASSRASSPEPKKPVIKSADKSEQLSPSPFEFRDRAASISLSTHKPLVNHRVIASNQSSDIVILDTEVKTACTNAFKTCSAIFKERERQPKYSHSSIVHSVCTK